MASRDDPNVIDGFSSVQAVKRASARRQGAKAKIHDSADEPGTGAKTPRVKVTQAADEAPKATPPRAAAHVAMPQKRLVICYSCGYSHTVSGQMHHSFCPKCKTQLNTADVTVAGRHVEDILTIGNVTISPDADFAEGVSITGQRIILDGDVTHVKSITATESLEMRSNAKFRGESIHNISGKVIVAAEHEVVLESPFACRELEVMGKLAANVSVTASARICPGGMLHGSFRGPSLLVEDGGGLVGDIDLNPDYREAPEDGSKRGQGARKVLNALIGMIAIGWGICAALAVMLLLPSTRG